MRHKSGGNSARRTPNSRNLIGIGKGLMLTINRFTFLFLWGRKRAKFKCLRSGSSTIGWRTTTKCSKEMIYLWKFVIFIIPWLQKLVSAEFKLIRIRNTCFAITRQGRSGHCFSGSSIFLICSQFHWIYSYKDTCKQIRKVHHDKAWSFFFRRVKHYGNYNTMNKEPVELTDKGCDKLLVDPENLNFSAELRVFLCVK